MEKKVIEGNQSNLEVQVKVDSQEYKQFEEKALKEL
jgi:hypothetical protein